MDWIRRWLPPCEAWARNGFAAMAETCREPAFAWLLATMVAFACVLFCGILLVTIGARRGVPPRWAAWTLVVAFAATGLAMAIAVIFLLVATAGLHAAELLHLVSQPWFVLPAAMAGVVLYAVRAQAPFAYGAIEIVVGLTMLVAVTLSAAAGGVAEGLLAKGIGLAGGVYVIVRGMDNMEKGLPPAWRAWWDRVLRGRMPDAEPGAEPTPPPDSSAPRASPPRRAHGSRAAPPR